MASVVGDIISRARAAQRDYEQTATQEDYDMAALAAAWALMEPTRNEALSKRAVAHTGLGRADHKILKNHRKTLGLLRDIAGVKTKGVIGEDTQTGITTVARAIGVIGAVVPSTNPLATPVNNVVNALKCGNAIVLSPSPKGGEVCEDLLGYIHGELRKIGVNTDLVQMLPLPSNKEHTQELMESVDLIIVTGSQDNVRRAYSSGTPAIGVGAGNVSVIIDETADLADAAKKIVASKTFDNATSCSAENALIVVDSVYDDFVSALENNGVFIVRQKDEAFVRSRLRVGGRLNSDILAKDMDIVLRALPLEHAPQSSQFIAVESEELSQQNPLCNEKMSLITGLFRARDFSHAQDMAAAIFAILGAGHSIGFYTGADERAYDLARALPTCRVIVNQPHCFATGGAFNNGMKFSLSMGCGSWGGNSIDDNLHYKHFMNVTKIVRVIAESQPDLADIFSSYWSVAGR